MFSFRQGASLRTQGLRIWTHLTEFLVRNKRIDRHLSWIRLFHFCFEQISKESIDAMFARFFFFSSVSWYIHCNLASVRFTSVFRLWKLSCCDASTATIMCLFWHWEHILGASVCHRWYRCLAFLLSFCPLLISTHSSFTIKTICRRLRGVFWIRIQYRSQLFLPS